MNNSTEIQQLQEAADALAVARRATDDMLNEIFWEIGGVIIFEVPGWLDISWEFVVGECACNSKTRRAVGKRFLLRGLDDVKVSPQREGSFFPHTISRAEFREMCGENWPGILLEPIQKKIEHERAALTILLEKKRQTDELRKMGLGVMPRI